MHILRLTNTVVMGLIVCIVIEIGDVVLHHRLNLVKTHSVLVIFQKLVRVNLPIPLLYQYEVCCPRFPTK